MTPHIQHDPTPAPALGKNGGIHWKTCTMMLASLFPGILLALGHHLFYNRLKGQLVGATEPILRGVTQQQLNIAIGTSFAFLVKTFLVVAVSIAYTQIMWKAIKKQAATLTTIDTVFHAVSSIWSLLQYSVWWKYPLLLLLACAVW
jgi:hypothetical protein